MEAFWLYLHILLLVFWVGTDVGVFIAAKWSEKTTLSMETRQTVLQLGMVLDRLPRSASDADHTLGLSIGRDQRLAGHLGHGTGCFVVIGRYLAGNSVARVFID